MEQNNKIYTCSGVSVPKMEPGEVPVHRVHRINPLHLLCGVHAVRPPRVQLALPARGGRAQGARAALEHLPFLCKF